MAKAKAIAFLSASEGYRQSELQQKNMIPEILHCGLAALALRSERQLRGLYKSAKICEISEKIKEFRSQHSE